MENMDWYSTLNKPLFTPPSEFFTPAWTILYILIAISFILYIKGGFSKSKIKGLVCFFIQLALNFVWGGIFFGMKSIGSALAVVVLMWIFILLTIIFFCRHSKLAAILLIPYLIWTTFACYINFGFFVLN